MSKLSDLAKKGIYYQPLDLPTEPAVAQDDGESGAGLMRTLGDVGIKAAQGVVDLGQGAVGLGSIATGGLLGKGLREIGYDPEGTNKFLGQYLSDEQNASDAAVENADGFVDTVGASLTNPRSILGGVSRSAPAMIAGMGITGGAARMIGTRAALATAEGAAAARAALAAGQGAKAAQAALATTEGSAAASAAVKAAEGRLIALGAATEGAQTSGNIADQAQAAGREYSDYVLPAIGAGVGTAAIGLGAGKLLGDAATDLATGGHSVKGGFFKAAGKSALSEGVLEEMPQSAQEQVLTNVAMGKDPMEGVENAAGVGLVTGAAMGAGLGGAGSFRKSPADTIRSQKVEESGMLSRAANAGLEAQAKQAEVDQETGEITMLGDGSVAPKAEVDALLSTVQGEEPKKALQSALFETADEKVSEGERPAQVPEVPSANDSAQASVSEAQAMPESTEVPELALSDEPAQDPADAIRARLKYINDQATLSGGWNRQMIAARDQARAELAALQPAVTAEQPGPAAEVAAPAVNVPPRVAGNMEPILNKQGEPFKTKVAAVNALKKVADTHELQQVEGGFILNPKQLEAVNGDLGTDGSDGRGRGDPVPLGNGEVVGGGTGDAGRPIGNGSGHPSLPGVEAGPDRPADARTDDAQPALNKLEQGRARNAKVDAEVQRAKESLAARKQSKGGERPAPVPEGSGSSVADEVQPTSSATAEEIAAQEAMDAKVKQAADTKKVITDKQGRKITLEVKGDGAHIVATNEAGEQVGAIAPAFDVRPGMAFADSEVKPEYRRSGVATAMYDLAEEISGLKLSRSGVTSPDADAFWDARNKRGEKASASPAPAVAQAGGPVTVDEPLLERAQADAKDAHFRFVDDLQNDQQGVIPGRPTAINESLKKGRYTLDEVSASFAPTREILRARHGDTVTLYRADAPKSEHHPDTQVVYMGDEKLAKRFANDGRKVTAHEVALDDIIALNAQKNGYYEFIVKRQGEPMGKPAPAPAGEGGQAPSRTDKIGDQHRAQREADEKAAQETEVARKSDDYNGFMGNKPELVKGRIRAALSKQYRFDGEVMTVRERVEALHNAGKLAVSTIEEDKIKPMSRMAFHRADQRTQDAHAKKVREGGKVTTYLVNNSELGKVGYDYAQHLIAKGQNSPAVSKESSNDPAVPVEVSPAQDSEPQATTKQDSPKAKPAALQERERKVAARKAKPLDHGELNIPGRLNGIDAELDKHKAAQEKDAKAKAKSAALQKREDKAQARELFAQHGQAMIAKFGDKHGKKELAAELDQMVKWEPAKFIKLAEKFAAEQQKGAVELFDIPSQYGDEHRPPGREDGASLADLTGNGTIYPDDVYSKNGPRYYGTGNDKHDANAFRIASLAKGKPDFDVMIYRAVPEGVNAEINPQDWVTIVRGYAEDHGESRFDGKYKILSKMVKAGDIFTNGDSILEWGYDPDQGAELSDITKDRRTLTIEVDGKRRPILNSKGQKVGQDFRSQLNFWKWFADSKVVDESGAPLVVYHGTAGDFADFDAGKAGDNYDGKWDRGIFFTNNNVHRAGDVVSGEIGAKVSHDVASTAYFAKVASKGRAAADKGGVAFDGANVMPVYAALQNPLIVEGTGRYTAIEYFDRNAKSLWATVDKTGHDGIIIKDAEHMIDGQPETIVVAMRPEQIKSAVGNAGTYSPDSPVITADLMQEPKLDGDQSKALSQLVKERASGKVTDAQMRAKLDEILNRAPARGTEAVKAELQAAKESGALEGTTADFGLWLLEKNPHLATDLQAQVKDAEGGQSGSYKSIERLMTLFKGTANQGTAVHEILHHAERMMPEQVQKGIASEWFRAYMKAWEAADAKTRTALEDMMSMDRSKSAFDRTVKAFEDGTLSYAEHYPLSNASEYWAVKATEILKRRYMAGSWIAKAKQWMSEMIEKVKALLGKDSDARILAALDGIIKGDGKFVSPNMLTQLEVQMDVKSLPNPAERRFAQVMQEAMNWLNSNGKTADLSGPPMLALDNLDFMMGMGTGNFSEKAKEQGRAIWDRALAAYKQLSRTGYDMGSYSFVDALDEGGRELSDINDQTKSAAFKKWFDQSKVVDESGNPRVVYHGRNAEVDQFDTSRSHVWFTEEREYAERYARGVEDINNEGGKAGHVVEAYLSVQNPLVLDFDLEDSPDAMADVLAELGLDFDAYQYRDAAWSVLDQPEVQQAIKDAGYDGIKAIEQGYATWSVFKPEQIKSVDNNGNFDPRDPVITHDIPAGPAASAGTLGDSLKRTTVTDVKKAVGHKLADFRNLALQTLGRRQLVDVYGKDFDDGSGSILAKYSELVQRMDAEKNEAGANADQIADDWGKLKDEGELANLMHDATLAQMDPALDYVPGDNRVKYNQLRKQYEALSDGAKEVYARARDTYAEHYAKVQKEIRAKIERAIPDSPRRAAMLEQMDAEFFEKVKGVYFPLARFGDYVVLVKDASGKTVSVSMAETMGEAEKVRKHLATKFKSADGFKVSKVTKKREFNAARDAVSRGFMQQLFGVLDQYESGGELQDDINQLYLSSLPDLSWAKHGIHRKGTPGFSQDARRAFAQNVFHGARYLAKLRYADRMQNRLDEMQDHVDAKLEDESFDSVKGQQVVDEMVKRHDAYMNPKANPLSSWLTSVGFVYFMGLSPASAIVNLTQTPLVAFPMMGAKYGYGKASKALLDASSLVMKNRNDLSQVLTGDELSAFNEAVDSGVIDVSMAHDLAGIASGDDTKAHAKIRPVMKWASFLFHHGEKFNRQATFLAAYRMERANGKTHEQAYEGAVKLTYDSHFDYSAGNRPRIMQGNVQRVVFLFKQYAQNMVYTLTRNAALAAKGDKQARKVLAGLIASHAMAAGVLGLPLVNTLLSALSTLGSDDDDPWDAKVALRNYLADAIGQKPAEILTHGVSRATPFDISGRVGLDKLLLPDVQEGLEGARLAESYMAAALGPVAGIGINAAKGMSKIAEGDYQRGLEDLLPVSLKNPVKAMRFASEGVQDKTGVSIVEDTSMVEEFGQLIGFSPSRSREAYEGKAAVYNADRKLNERRSQLVAQWAQARMADDRAGVMEAMAEIRAWNGKHRERSITPSQLAQSFKNRRRRITEAESGIYLPKKRRGVMELGRFAEQDE